MFTLAVSADGTRLASASFQRSFSPIALTETTPSLTADGFVGEFWHPADTAARRPAVLVYATDQQAHAVPWPRLLGFLAALAHNPAS